MITKPSILATATLAAAAADREWFLLENQSGTDIRVSFEGDDAASLTPSTGSKPGVLVKSGNPPMAFLAMHYGLSINNPIYAITEDGSTGKALIVHQCIRKS